MKRVLIAGFLISCMSLTACKTTNGIKKGETDLNGSTSSSYKENSTQYFNEVIKNKVYFATDRDSLTDEAIATLGSQAEWLKKYNRHATIEGHCDERGTREYNIALGERRANNVKRELVKNGVECGKIKTVSYGKERPEVEGSDENAWAMNRRGVTVVDSAE